MENSKMTVLVVEPQTVPYTKEIDSSLKSLQNEVGGLIQTVYPFEEPVAIICNEEGRLNGLPLNRALRDDDGHMYYLFPNGYNLLSNALILYPLGCIMRL